MYTNDPSYKDDTAQADELFEAYIEEYGYRLECPLEFNECEVEVIDKIALQIASDAYVACTGGTHADSAKVRVLNRIDELNEIFRAVWDKQLKDAAIEQVERDQASDKAERLAEAKAEEGHYD